MPNKERAEFRGDLTPEQRHQQAGMRFGEEYHRRMSEPRTDLSTPYSYPLYVSEELQRMEPPLHGAFMGSAEAKFQELATKDLIKQGLPQNQAEAQAFDIARAFRGLAEALYKNNLGVGRTPIRRKGTPS